MQGTSGTSCRASPCSGPFSQTTPMPARGAPPSPILPTMGIRRVKTPQCCIATPGHPLPNLLCSGPHSVALAESPHHGLLPALPSPPATHLPLPTEEQPSCWYLTELHNLTKGPCYLDQVEVSHCGGHCPSSTNVLPEVSRDGGCRPGGVRSSGGPQWPVAVSLEPSQGPEDTRDKVHLTSIQLIRARGEFSPRWWHTCHLAR